MKKAPLLLLAMLCRISQFPFAQTQRVVADKIVAKIDDKIILQSDVILREPIDLPRLHPECLFLESQLVQKELCEEAVKDSIVVTNMELDSLLEALLNSDPYGSISAEEADKILENIRGPFKARLIADKMRSKIIDTIKVAHAEVKEFFEKIPADSVAFVEHEMKIQEIVVYAKGSEDEEEKTIQKLTLWKQQIESGAKKFADLARLYSMDPGSYQQGGIYNVHRSDKQWDSVWFSAIWKLKEGEISPVIKSKFGFHIIQMISRVDNDATVRHILLMPPVSQQAIVDAKQKSNSIRKQIIEGITTFANAVRLYSEDDESRNNGGFLVAFNGSNTVTVDCLDNETISAIKDLKQGDISEPLVCKDIFHRYKVRLFFLKKNTAPHRENLEDDYDKVAEKALECKKNTVLEKWITDHISLHYIDIDKSYKACENLAPWFESTKSSNVKK